MQKQLIYKISSALLIVMLVMAALPVEPARAAPITVNILTDEDATNGNCSLREAIIAANTDAAYRGCSAGSGADTITLTSGSTYPLTSVANNDLDVTSNITVQASGATHAIIDPNAPAFNDRVFDLTATGNLTLNTIRITTAETLTEGAAIRNTGGVVTIIDSRFDNNYADLEAGAIFNDGGTVTITNSIFDSNSTGLEGGALYNVLGAGTFDITGSTFTSNSSLNDNDGGAIFQAPGGTITIIDSTFTSNAASDDGGAIYNTAGATISVRNSTFETNTAIAALSASSTAEGGAIRNLGDVTVQLSSFINNTARVESDDLARGGAIANNGTLTLANSTFSGNLAEKTVAGVIITGNAQGGAVFSGTLSTTASNVTFSGNAVTSVGGGGNGGNIHNPSGTFTISNSILRGGTENGAAGNCGGTITNGGNNILFGGLDCGAGFTNLDPLLGALTGSPQYFPLNTGSPAIDTGNNAVCAAAPVSNESQNGVTRPVGAACDIGSYEASVNTAPTVSSPIADVTVLEDAVNTVFSLYPSFADAQDADAQLAFTVQTNTNLALFTTVDITNPTLFTLDYAPNANGTSNITVRATDTGGLFVEDTFLVTVTAVNDEPDFTASNPPAVSEDAGAQSVVGWVTSFNLGPPDEVSSQSVLGYIISNNASCATLLSAGPAVSAAGTLTYTPAANQNGTCTFDAQVQDNGGTANGGDDTGPVRTFTITVNAANDPPSFTSVPVTTATQGVLYTYNIVTTDPDAGDTLVITASTLPAWLAFVDNGNRTATLSGTPANTDIGSHSVVLRVTDGIIPVPVEQAFTIIVDNVNDPPIFTSLPVTTAGESVLYTYNVVTDDPDAGDTLVISATTLPAWLTLVDNGNRTALLSGTPGGGDVGVHNVVLQVTDGALTATQIFDITVTNTAPLVNGINTVADTGDGVLVEAEIVSVGVTQMLVTFNQDVYNPPGNTDPDDVTNPANYLLVRDNGDGFQTASCAVGVSVLDTAITINSVVYPSGGGSGPFTAAVSINDGLPLSNGSYRFFVCGTTSIVDIVDNTLALAGDGVNPGTDFIRNFIVAIVNNGNGDNDDESTTIGFAIPASGFAPHQVTLLPIQPADQVYKSVDEMRIEIPTLGINFPIVGASLNKRGWDLTWLQNSVAYLEGSAYPTLSGNTVFSAHVTDANKNIGPFSDIKGMQLGQMIYIHANGQVYVYQVQANRKILPSNTSAVFKHEKYDWITLVTCEDFNEKTGLYKYRRMVRAVLISVIPEK